VRREARHLFVHFNSASTLIALSAFEKRLPALITAR